METFSALLALCVGNSPVIGEFPSQRPVMWSFDVFFDLGLNKRLSKQSRCWWFETPVWFHCDAYTQKNISGCTFPNKRKIRLGADHSRDLMEHDKKLIRSGESKKEVEHQSYEWFVWKEPAPCNITTMFVVNHWAVYQKMHWNGLKIKVQEITLKQMKHHHKFIKPGAQQSGYTHQVWGKSILWFAWKLRPWTNEQLCRQGQSIHYWTF